MNSFRILLACALAAVTAAPLRAQDERTRDEQILRNARISIDGQSLIRFLRERTPGPEQRARILKLIEQCGDKSFQVRRRAANELEKIGQPAIGLLRQALKDPDPEIVRACTNLLAEIETTPTELLAAAAIRMLGRLKSEGTIELILSQFSDAEDQDVSEALRWALAQTAVDDGKPNEKVVAALQDESPARRGAAGEALIAAKAAGVEPLVRKLLDDPDSGVRLRVALALVELAKDKALIAKLIELSPKAPASLAWRAEDLLYRLADGEGPKVSLLGDLAQREEFRKAWADWWSVNAAKVKMEKLSSTPKELGYTLVLEMNAGAGQGKAIEFGPDNKTVRWQIDGLAMPTDAQVLPKKDRVLIAEYRAHRVSERDYQGRIHWTKDVSMPVACERLPNGNTFIAHRRGLVEYNSKDEEVFRFDRNSNDIVAGRKGRNGGYYFLTRTGLLAQVDAKGKIEKSITTGRSYTYSSIELLPNNRVLVALLNSVAEYDLATGKAEWQSNVRTPVSATRVVGGRTLVTSVLQRKVLELDRDGKVVKEFALPDGGIPYRAKRR